MKTKSEEWRQIDLVWTFSALRMYRISERLYEASANINHIAIYDEGRVVKEHGREVSWRLGVSPSEARLKMIFVLRG